MMHIAGGILLAYLAIAFGLPLIALTVAGIGKVLTSVSGFMWLVFGFMIFAFIGAMHG